jgi:radical SAM superfamily enzyme YgiQ (UPF0313 family)
VSDIILSSLNARYIHCSLGLRYLLANMGELRARTRLQEYNISSRDMDIAEDLIKRQPKIIGFGVYIWNLEQTTRVVQLIKTIAPDIIIVLGGPEVSYEYEHQPLVALADYLVTGTADLAFAELCRTLLAGKKPLQSIIHSLPFELSDIRLPYGEYTDEDVANRIVYVEASRGCPFKCEFCLSSLDKSVSPFDLELFLQQMQSLYQRGVRHFKFVDRTFNLKAASSMRIMEFFLDKMEKDGAEDLFLHFELIPDNLPEKLKAVIARFPPHSLQFEIGIQSLNPQVQALISRRQNTEKTRANLHWLGEHSNAHIHADLIIGLPGEDLASFADGFNQLYAMGPDEIQVGVLKRLKGTPIIRYTDEYRMRYNPLPPFNILSNSLLDFATMQRLNRFARYWDIIINNGRFKHSQSLLLGEQAFENFLAVSDWLYTTTDQTHRFALDRLFVLLHRAMIEVLERDPQQVEQCLIQDFQRSGLKGQPKFIEPLRAGDKSVAPTAVQRQKRHLN